MGVRQLGPIVAGQSVLCEDDVPVTDPLSGHWILDLALSDFSAHTPRAWELFVRADSFGMSVEEHLTQADGTTLHVKFTPRFDGRDSPATGSPFFDSIAVVRPHAAVLKSRPRRVL